MNERRLHPFTVLRFLRKTLVVYLLPLVQVLFERNWTALHTALRQDALLFLLLCAVSWGILRVSSWSMDDTGVFHLYWRLGIRLDRALRGEMLAALTIDRPLLYRMAGASRLTLYPVGAAQKHTLSSTIASAIRHEPKRFHFLFSIGKAHPFIFLFSDASNQSWILL